MSRALFIFHRDLNEVDNLTLYRCLQRYQKVYVAFIFTPEQVSVKNSYRSLRSIHFMCTILKDLSTRIRMSFFYGKSDQVLKQLLGVVDVSAVWESVDVTPFAINRQTLHSRVCKASDVEYVLQDTISLYPIGALFRSDGSGYKKFTPFYLNATKYTPRKPIRAIRAMLKRTHKIKCSFSVTIRDVYVSILPRTASVPPLGGVSRQKALNILRALNYKQRAYYQDKDYPYLDATTHMSAYLHFGVVSPHEFYWYVRDTVDSPKSAAALIRQLYWREFYLNVIYCHHPTYIKKSVTMIWTNKLKWSTNKNALSRWQQGVTGIPFVDAGMRELLHTGYIHNRMRMVVAMFLIHYLRIHWSEGEQWFAQHLVDYSYCNNLGGWLWCASIEVYSNPYYKVFSIPNQMATYDTDAIYVKQWCPELVSVKASHLYNWPEHMHKYEDIEYPKPIITDLTNTLSKRIAYIRGLHH